MKIEDLYVGFDRWEVQDKYFQNLVDLLPRINAIEAATGLPLKSTSGFRSWARHKEIYQQKNDQRLIQGLPELPIPLHSRHLTGNADDFVTPDLQKLKSLLVDEKILIDNGLWAEAFAQTPTWVHVQNIPYASWVPGGSRFFKPF